MHLFPVSSLTFTENREILFGNCPAEQNSLLLHFVNFVSVTLPRVASNRLKISVLFVLYLLRMASSNASVDVNVEAIETFEYRAFIKSHKNSDRFLTNIYLVSCINKRQELRQRSNARKNICSTSSFNSQSRLIGRKSSSENL